MEFAEDHFSQHAGDYANHRPSYPKELFAYLASLCASKDIAWDCGTGNGQAAILLAEHFTKVVATDASSEQIAAAEPHPAVHYTTAPAESAPLESGSVDLITVAQAAHWFDLDAFYSEAERVLKPEGVLAVWCYGLSEITPEIDALVSTFFAKTVGPYWPDKRKHIDNGYTTLPFPYPLLTYPPFQMELSWTSAQLLNYLRTWSAVKRYEQEHGTDPVTALGEKLAPLWHEEVLPVRWPLTLKLGRRS